MLNRFISHICHTGPFPPAKAILPWCPLVTASFMPCFSSMHTPGREKISGKYSSKLSCSRGDFTCSFGLQHVFVGWQNLRSSFASSWFKIAKCHSVIWLLAREQRWYQNRKVRVVIWRKKRKVYLLRYISSLLLIRIPLFIIFLAGYSQPSKEK